MCGIFGVVAVGAIDVERLRRLASHAQQRGSDASGLLFYDGTGYTVVRSNDPVGTALRELPRGVAKFAMGHSRLVTNSLDENQPVRRNDLCLVHNGIVVNHEAVWARIGLEPRHEIDSEAIAGVAEWVLLEGGRPEDVAPRVLEVCEGTVATAVALTELGELCLFSNNGSLYGGRRGADFYFSSEEFPLTQIGCVDISQIREGSLLVIPQGKIRNEIERSSRRRSNLIPALGSNMAEERMLISRPVNLRRCTRCVLPETMPFITFDAEGVCNYCLNYQPRNRPKPAEELQRLLDPYRRDRGSEAIVPFSGGRDSSFALHLIVNEFGMRPIAYTYDWGMVTDLGRRNISRMCAKLGVENIVIAADIRRKRANIRANLTAWLKRPDLGMVSILTAGDKHFFRHVEDVRKQTGVSLHLWGVNPLEVTHFKAGFLGVPPDFEEKRVYSHGLAKQARYQSLRLRAMLRSPGYFNSSLWDTLSGEYYRSFHKKVDYFHVFDYWRWDEREIDDALAEYDWEKAPDTKTTWRIGDGTAAFYNYIYYTVAGFSEHDTFRSNQIREGDLTRTEALALVEEENQPRYPNIKWYLDAVGLDFFATIRTVNAIPRLLETS